MPSWTNRASPETTVADVHGSVDRTGPAKQVTASTPLGALTRTSACVTAPIDEPVTSQENSGTAFGERSAPRTV